MVWVGRDLIDSLGPTPLPWTGTPSTRPGCSKSRPAWPRALPGRGQSQLLWAAWARASPPSEGRISSLSISSLFQLEAITPCPITPCPCKNPSSRSLAGPFRYWQAALWSPQSLLFSRLNSPKVTCRQLCTFLHVPLLTPLVVGNLRKKADF